MTEKGLTGLIRAVSNGLEKEADSLGLTGVSRAVFLARGGFGPDGPLDPLIQMRAVMLAHIRAGHSQMAAQCARRLVRLSRERGVKP